MTLQSLKKYFLGYIKSLIPSPNHKRYILNPVFLSQKELIDQLYRLTWYLPYRDGVKIRMNYYGFNLNKNLINAESLRPQYMHSYPLNLDGIYLQKSPNIFFSLVSNFFKKGIILNWKCSYKLPATLNKINNTVVVDHTIKSYNSDINYVSLAMRSAGPYALSKALNRSRDIFENSVRKFKKKYKKSYIFGRGPSLEKALTMDFSDGVRIVCNQIVNNSDLMNRIKPDIIIAGDHCWNIGCNKLSDHFRRDTVNWIRNNDTFFVLPLDSYQLILNHFPEIKGKLVGIPYGAKSHNFDLLKQFNTMGSFGVFFEFLFPLACTITDVVMMLGFDGYNKSTEQLNNKVAFSHYRPSEYPDHIVASVYESRPGYYDRCLTEFRENYDNMFIEIIDCALDNGISVHTLAPSHHTALQKRYIFN